jgi:hypothetical protein
MTSVVGGGVDGGDGNDGALDKIREDQKRIEEDVSGVIAKLLEHIGDLEEDMDKIDAAYSKLEGKTGESEETWNKTQKQLGEILEVKVGDFQGGVLKVLSEVHRLYGVVSVTKRIMLNMGGFCEFAGPDVVMCNAESWTELITTAGKIAEGLEKQKDTLPPNSMSQTCVENAYNAAVSLKKLEEACKELAGKNGNAATIFKTQSALTKMMQRYGTHHGRNEAPPPGEDTQAASATPSDEAPADAAQNTTEAVE